MKTNTKQFPKDQLFDLEVLEQTAKGLEKNFLPIYSKWRRLISPQFSAYMISMATKATSERLATNFVFVMVVMSARRLYSTNN